MGEIVGERDERLGALTCVAFEDAEDSRKGESVERIKGVRTSILSHKRRQSM